MKSISSTAELKNAIQILEKEQHIKGTELIGLYAEAYRSFNPIGKIGASIKGVVTSPGVLENLLVGGFGLVSGYLTRKLVVGASTNIFRKILGTALQLGTTRVITQNSGTIKSVGYLLYRLFLSKMKESKQV